MATPNASYSLRIRVRLENVPGTLGRVATAIGDAGGSIVRVDLVEGPGPTVLRDVIVFAGDEAQMAAIGAAVGGVAGVVVESVHDRTFDLHHRGKISVSAKVPLAGRDDLAMAYTPGVARVCRAIADRPAETHCLTMKANTVAVVTDGSAVLGLGNIGPAAALPVMEGKAVLFKQFAGVDAVPVCLDVDGPDELVETVQRLAVAFGGVNLEDIAAPACFEVERRLQDSLDVPVFHDDQHGTAVVVLAALRNSLQLVGKKIEAVRVVVSGMGAAGVAVTKMLVHAGVGEVVGVDRQGALHPGLREVSQSKRWVAEHTNAEGRRGSLPEVLVGADVFVGVSAPGLLTADDLRSMAPDPVVFALANPDPEISPEDAGGAAAVIATGRSDYPNQINNVLCFPGFFRGALDSGATTVTDGMKLAAAAAIAEAVPSDELSPTYVVPNVFDHRVAGLVADAVADAAEADGVVRRY
ncbi:MAG TPA: NAD-dependent malic enzyme [Acidimicrobiales bacterium]|nr:NAD-dependent malic enzyme [Acidimicrobiales bacterium]